MDNKIILQSAFEKIDRYIKSNSDNKSPVVKFKMPAELSTIIDPAVSEKGVTEKGFLELIDKYLEYSVRTGTKQFLNQLYSGFNFPAFIGEVITTLANTSMYTYEVAPAATVIETEMIRLMNRYAGYSQGDGIFLSGGSNANLVAMFSARNRVFPAGRFEGYNPGLKLKAFINEQAHYSFETAANVLGIGAKNVVKVKSDNQGRMIPGALEREIDNSLRKGEKPFFVVATCATKLTGAYDPLEEIAEICNRHDIWLHADGSFGGSLILSDRYRHLMNGVEKTDSFAWKYYGLEGYRARIDNSIEMAAFAEEKVKEHPSLELLTPRQSFAVCFRYIPERKMDLNKFNLELRESLRKSGKSIVNYGYLSDTLAIRLITANGELERSDIELFFDNLLTKAKRLDRINGFSVIRDLQRSADK